VTCVIYVARYVLIMLYTGFWASTVTVLCIFDRSGESGVWGARMWARWILATCGIQVDVEGLENAESSHAFVVMSNHQSVFDIVALVATLPLSFRFVAKRELTYIPFFGWGLIAAGHIVIDRSRNERAVASLKRAAERIQAGTSVIIFPEGTRSKTTTMRDFKSGGFHLAMQAGVPVLPASISGSRRITPRESLRVESGRILVRYGKRIATAGIPLESREDLKERVRQAILDGFDPALQSE
jgi:1-acyl-sn-glycerol-3-phosphate acyltransferase